MHVAGHQTLTQWPRAILQFSFGGSTLARVFALRKCKTPYLLMPISHWASMWTQDAIGGVDWANSRSGVYYIRGRMWTTASLEMSRQAAPTARDIHSCRSSQEGWLFDNPHRKVRERDLCWRLLILRAPLTRVRIVHSYL